MTRAGEWPVQLGILIKSARRHRGWTQGELARRAGTDQKTVSRLELGLNDRPDAKALLGCVTALMIPRANILDALGLPIENMVINGLVPLDDADSVDVRETYEGFWNLAWEDQQLVFDLVRRLTARLARRAKP